MLAHLLNDGGEPMQTYEHSLYRHVVGFPAQSARPMEEERKNVAWSANGTPTGSQVQPRLLPV
jgi:hypothetical protein